MQEHDPVSLPAMRACMHDTNGICTWHMHMAHEYGKVISLSGLIHAPRPSGWEHSKTLNLRPPHLRHLRSERAQHVRCHLATQAACAAFARHAGQRRHTSIQLHSRCCSCCAHPKCMLCMHWQHTGSFAVPGAAVRYAECAGAAVPRALQLPCALQRCRCGMSDVAPRPQLVGKRG